MKYWVQALKDGRISGLTFRMYLAGYKGVLTGTSVIVPESEWESCYETLSSLGGSPIGNSRVKLTNVQDCIARGYVAEGGTPLEVASQQLLKDHIHVLHTIGGDDTNTQAATLSGYLLKQHGGRVTVIGMPKTVDNDGTLGTQCCGVAVVCS
jgi:diphosphate-dependent phosphofructokinase